MSSSDYSYEEDVSDSYVFDYHMITPEPDDIEKQLDLSRSMQDSLSFDESQALHDTLHDSNAEIVIQPSQDNPNIVYSNNLQRSREFLSQVFNIPPTQFKRFHIPGLIILRLEDFALIRNDNRCARIIPHILVNGDLNGLSNNPDFTTAINQLNI